MCFFAIASRKSYMVILWLFFFHAVEFMSNRCFKLIENGKNIYIQIFMVCIHRVHGVDYKQFAWDFPAIGVMEPTNGFQAKYAFV